MESKTLWVMNVKKVLFLKPHMYPNRTFKVELKVMEHRCISTIASREKWVWHNRFRHLNFLCLNALQRNKMVTGMPLINIPAEICEECAQAKQHKCKLSINAGCKTKCHLEAVYSDVCGLMQVDSIGGNKYFDTFINDHSRKL